MLETSLLISIIIPNFNREGFIKQTLQSLQDQTYKNWEAIIIDDGSTDNSHQIINDFCAQDKRIRFFLRNRLPKGAPVCRNIGIEKARGEYIIFLDSDDILAPYCLEKRIEYCMIYPDKDALIFPMLIFHKKPGDSFLLWSDYTGNDALSQFLHLQSPWQTTGPIWKRKAVLSFGGWGEDVLTWQDWEFHIKALIKGVSYKIVDTLPDCFLRRDEHERISAGDMGKERLYAKLKLFEKVFSIIPESQKQICSCKQPFAHLFFNHAERTAIKWPNEKLAFYFHSKLKEYKLISVYLYRIISVYILLLSISKKSNLSFLTSFVYKVGHVVLPKKLVKFRAEKQEARISDLELMQINKVIRTQNV
jgi:glycosyltransferase involved in cell wall biosynthesis